MPKAMEPAPIFLFIIRISSQPRPPKSSSGITQDRKIASRGEVSS